MRVAVRAIIIRDDKLLVMHRSKFGHEYYTLIGGGVNLGEDIEAALYRELKEEAGLACQNPRLVFVQTSPEPYGTQYVYLCDYVGGEPALAHDSDEAAITTGGQNVYIPMWLDLKLLPEVTFRSEVLKQAILDSLKNGFPNSPKTLQET